MGNTEKNQCENGGTAVPDKPDYRVLKTSIQCPGWRFSVREDVFGSSPGDPTYPPLGRKAAVPSQ
jgi:hypothetical protein